MQTAFRGATSQALKFANITVPASVQVIREADQLIFSGPLGTTSLGLSRIDTEGSSALKLLPAEREIAICSVSKSFHGTLGTLIQNKLHGVTQGYIVYLRIQGIGYRASLKEQTLNLRLGFSHDIAYTLPQSLRAFLPEPTLIGLYGIDKNEVTQAAARIRALRPPSVYKGKGIRLVDEQVRVKAGKKK
ncbi:hypothetical protein WJX73_001759 [Symbiochloris irregularis]|uniref:Large ribosomal subunit protein uL6 alpha-beta domain-containing protein n=1 Tax=Symbiochloris irregularis TaxID=706552 RepID=A0AAW1PFG1_9CHLO